MERNLFLVSMAEFASLTLPILEIVNARTICEIGVDHGGNSKILHDYVQAKNGTLYSIDPKPARSFLNWLSQASHVKHIAKKSLLGINDVQTADAWFVDGDHNWYTVFNELIQIREAARKQNRPILIFAHDVSWPFGRRDLYFSPDDVPEQFRQPLTWDMGMTLDVPGVIQGGFRSCGAWAIALKEGGPRNGVMSAIEDFIAQYPKEFCFAHIPVVLGLGVLFDATHPNANDITRILLPFHENPLLKKLEQNRLDGYLRVLYWQDVFAELNAQKQSVPVAGVLT